MIYTGFDVEINNEIKMFPLSRPEGAVQYFSNLILQ